MAYEYEHQPGDTAPATGYYRLVNVFGSPTGYGVRVQHGEPLPTAPRGHGWRLENKSDEGE
jgi:hypothetical protein